MNGITEKVLEIIADYYFQPLKEVYSWSIEKIVAAYQNMMSEQSATLLV